MRYFLSLFPVLMCLAFVCSNSTAEPVNAVLTYHGDQSRTGNFVIPRLSWRAARNLHLDRSFHASISGDVNAQPLVWHSAKDGRNFLIVASEDDTVYALDADSGKPIWQQKIGRPVPGSQLPCGNIDPLGITGTPAIDPARGILYAAAMLLDDRGQPQHEVFALSLETGSIAPGWPVNTAAALKAQGQVFDTVDQNQRGALALLNGKLFVPYGGHFGDCGHYHGWVVGIDPNNPRALSSWHTQANGGAIWSPGGISSDGRSLFVATGNTMDATSWQGGEAIIRLPPDLQFSAKPNDFFAPSDWAMLDERDLDLGGVAPVLIELAKPMVLALGKDGRAYLLDRNNLGGIGGGFASVQVSSSRIRGTAATFPMGASIYAAFQGSGISCPQRGANGLTVIRLSSSAPAISTAWCAAMDGRGSPIVTTTDGHTDPVVWILGAEGDNRLYGFRGDTGERLYLGQPLPGLQHFQTLIATSDHLYVAAQNAVYALRF